MCFVSNLGMGAAHLPGYLAALKEESARNLSRIARGNLRSAGGIQPLNATVGRKGGGSASSRVFAPSAELEGRAHASTHAKMSAHRAADSGMA
jgi:hypothetical protein